ncbi:aldo/keto reductase [Aurantiacibacter gangjinensis]|uniref:Aldo/keto reductase n=1 Tax=Aurantiacibacter gangjinensis TaxID=502682 RepID=A0A0G9MMR4_9SPHN|nr:aldo/keto reductase [Aurantiacibacter gangjinensis]APE27960.1 Oxidoreductase, aldo/keto reductase family [Aurantiacibacter gangjinensis]KLE31904.1 aldo/keto reductase [Aurantiacibacter gangjinensis]
MTHLPAPRRRRLGTTGITPSPLGWGMWRTGGSVDETATLLHAALDAGIDLIDTADIYGWTGSGGFGDIEALLGEVLRGEPGMRDRITLVTKGGICLPKPYDQSRDYMESALDASLGRLGTDRIDIYLIHRPDILTHPQELARFLDDAVASGKVRAFGVSNFTTAQIATLDAMLDAPLSVTQPEISPLRIEPLTNGEMDQAMELGLLPMAWSPLAGGRLMQPQTARELAVAEALDSVAEQHAVSRAVAAYGWLMAHPAGIVPIVGSQDPVRITEAAQAMGMRWTRAEWYGVYTAARGEPLP